VVRRLCSFAIGILALTAPVPAAHAFLSRDVVEISFEVVVNDVAGTRWSGCGSSVELDYYSKREWSIEIAGAGPQSESGETNPVRILCTDTVSSEPRDASHLRADISTVARLIRQMEDERFLEVGITVALTEPSGSGPSDPPAEVKRMLFFSEPRDAFVPLLIVSGNPQDASGIREVFLRVSARVARDESVMAYGVVTVTSDVEADLLLDGGRVGQISVDSTTTLRNVRAGLRELRIRDTAGREIGKTVRVRADRSVHVNLAANPPQRPYRRSFLGRNEQGYEEYRRHADGAVAVKIPAGEFLMGNQDTERTPLEHRVYVSEFLMDKTGVTWGQYRAFTEATRMPLPRHRPYWGIHDDQPVVYVSWEEAEEYCNWAGGRLPTEAEREKAARGTDDRKYPWGDEDPDPERAVFRRSWGHQATGAVASHPAGISPYGLHDMGGNVWEWCADWYDGDYYAESPFLDPKGPKSGSAHVVRGGSWDSRPTVLSASCRSWGHRGYRDGDFGFRCAMNSPTSQPEPTE